MKRYNETRRRPEGTIPKWHFPSLVRETLEKMEPNMRQNLASAWRTTGLHPIDPEPLLKKLPGGMAKDLVAKMIGNPVVKYMEDKERQKNEARANDKKMKSKRV